MKSSENSFIRIVPISFIAAIAGLLFGYDTGIISGALQFIVTTFHISPHDALTQEIIVASVPIGAFIGAVVSQFLSNRLGRKYSIITTAILFSIGTLVAADAHSISEVVSGRLLMGLAVGISAMIVPMYLSELAPQKIRGSLVFCFQLAINVGLFSAFLINYLFVASENWRAMFAVGIVPSIILGIGMLFLPCSPRWLVYSRRDLKAKHTLRKLRCTGDIEQEFQEIKSSVANQQGNFFQLWKSPVRPVSLICFFLFGFQQLTGINTIMYYAPIIYQYAGFKGAEGQVLAAVGNGVTLVFVTMLGMWLVDKLGRRKLFMIGFVGMVICLSLLGLVYQHRFGQAASPSIAMVAVICYILFFGVSIGPLAYLIMSELFPLNVRSSGMALASCGNWGFNVLVSSTFLTLVHLITIADTFYFYAFCTLIGCVFCYFFIPETKGMSLESIEKNLYSGLKTRNIGYVSS